MDHRQSPGCHHPTHLMIFPLIYSDPAFPGIQHLQLRRQADFAVRQHDASGKSFHILRRYLPLMPGNVYLFTPLFGEISR